MALLLSLYGFFSLPLGVESARCTGFIAADGAAAVDFGAAGAADV
jgi:hypothetical protein